MKTDVDCVSPKESAADAARLMRKQDVVLLPVCDKLGQVVGTVSDRDITRRLVAENLPASTRVENIMTREVISCSAQDDIGTAEDLMSENRRCRILCIDEAGRLEGIVSLSDIAQTAECGSRPRALQQAGQCGSQY